MPTARTGSRVLTFVVGSKLSINQSAYRRCLSTYGQLTPSPGTPNSNATSSGAHRRPENFAVDRKIIRKGLGKFAVLYFFGVIWILNSYKNRRYYDYLHKMQMFEASVESGDWKCYNALRQYSVECAHLDPYVESEMEICQTLHGVMDQCKHELEHIVNSMTSNAVTPAMKPPAYLFNRPLWLRTS